MLVCFIQAIEVLVSCIGVFVHKNGEATGAVTLS